MEELGEAANGGWIDRPFMFLGRRGAGDVIGRIKRCAGSETDKLAIEGRPPKEVPGKALRGTRFTGESGEEEGDGSDSEEESVHETVVVGDESADSDACMDALSWCWRVGATAGGCKMDEGSDVSWGLHVGSMFIILGSTTVTVSWSCMAWSRSKTLMKEGI